MKPSKPLQAVAAIPRSEEANFLRMVGRRVRESREQHGLTRRSLALQADVSERYLGQLESGEGNSSIVLLRRVALALQVEVSEWLKSGTAREARRQRIALIGLRGAGKSTLGARLAQDLDVPFVEMDREIEAESGFPLAELFSLYGQAGYRRFEGRCLERIVRDFPRAVLAIGGGVVAEPGTYDFLLANCRTVWLKASPAEHMQRVLAQGDMRPMAESHEAMEDLKRILAAREPLYRKADEIVDTSNSPVDASLARLRDAVARI